jgi:N utilization substance protein B
MHLEPKKEARRFAEKLFFRTLENEPELDEVIIKHIKNWEIQRLALIDRLILKMALCEFLYFDEIPTKVTINEAIEIAKKILDRKVRSFCEWNFRCFIRRPVRF